MQKLENCIPDFQYFLTTEGWELVETINISSKILILKEGRLRYENPKQFSLFPYDGIITEFSITEESIHDFSKEIGSQFYFKTYKEDLKTYIKPLQFIKENVLWSGNLCSLSFKSELGAPVFLPVSNGINYVFIKIN